MNDEPKNTAIGDWRMVPAEPTDAMCEAADRAPLPLVMYDSMREKYRAEFGARWKAALAAAPHPPEPREGGTYREGFAAGMERAAKITEQYYNVAGLTAAIRANEGPDDAIRAEASRTPAGEMCQTCQGNGEVVTDWELYLHARPGDIGDEAVAKCPDCGGYGSDTEREAAIEEPAPSAPPAAALGEPVAWQYRDQIVNGSHTTGWGPWILTEREPEPSASPIIVRETRPLYISPPDLAARLAEVEATLGREKVLSKLWWTKAQEHAALIRDMEADKKMLCPACGSEGHIYSGHPNDPHPTYVGVCPECDGEGLVERSEECSDVPDDGPIAWITKTALTSWLAGSDAEQHVFLRRGGDLRMPIYLAQPDLASVERERDEWQERYNAAQTKWLKTAEELEATEAKLAEAERERDLANAREHNHRVVAKSAMRANAALRERVRVLIEALTNVLPLAEKWAEGVSRPHPDHDYVDASYAALSAAADSPAAPPANTAYSTNPTAQRLYDQQAADERYQRRIALSSAIRAAGLPED